MAGEDRLGAFLEALDRIGYVEVGSAAIGGLEHLLIAVNLAERIRQAFRIASELYRGGVSQIFALAADRQLDNLSQDGRQDREDEGERHDEDHEGIAATLAI